MRIASSVALFMVSSMTGMIGNSCVLNSEGQGTDDEEDFVPDITPDETSPDVFEVDIAEAVEEGAAEEVRDETDDESESDEVEPDESTDTPDAEEAEDVAEAEDEGGEEDGETEDSEVVDPCALPEVPTTGVYLFYCPEDIAPTDMVLGRWVEREGAPNVEWGYEPFCRTSSAYFLWCNLSSYTSWAPATIHFNIAMDEGRLWAYIADPPGTPVSPYGLPRLWRNGVELTLGTASNLSGGYNYTVRF